MKSPTRILVLILAGIPALLAQRTTQLTGRITDATAAVIPGAEITVTHEILEHAAKRQAMSWDILSCPYFSRAATP
jgi:hypothetical protein